MPSLKDRSMKLCIPVVAPMAAGEADLQIDPHLPHASYLFFFDTESRVGRTLDVREASGQPAESLHFDAVLCGSIDRITLRHLLAQGVKVYGIDAATTLAAIAQYEAGELEAVVSEPGACAGHGPKHGHGAAAQGCGGGGCGGHGQGACGHEHDQGHGACGNTAHAERAAGQGCAGACGCGGHEKIERKVEAPNSAEMKIAVCSQNRKTVTDHAGKCRKFWIYSVRDGQIEERTLLELPLEQALHASPAGEPHPLDDIDVLIAGSMGGGLQQRLRARGIVARVTSETDLETAVAAVLAGAQEETPVATACGGGCGSEAHA